jgi:hypothetical protein
MLNVAVVGLVEAVVRATQSGTVEAVEPAV